MLIGDHGPHGDRDPAELLPLRLLLQLQLSCPVTPDGHSTNGRSLTPVITSSDSAVLRISDTTRFTSHSLTVFL